MMARKREYTIQRSGRLERTVVGMDGQKHVMEADRAGMVISQMRASTDALLNRRLPTTPENRYGRPQSI